jgi:hypothetical protein
VDRQRDNVKVTFWPKPNNSSYTFKAWTLKRVSNVDKSYQLIDLPSMYLPAIIAGLQYYMAKLKSQPLEIVLGLKSEYYEILQNALDEDRERVSLLIYPSNRTQLGS